MCSLKDRMRNEIVIGGRVSVNGRYSTIQKVDAIGDGIVYTEDGVRHDIGNLLAVAEDNYDKWIADCARNSSFYTTLCGQRTACCSAEEQAEDLLVRAYMMSRSGELDAYMHETYGFELPENVGENSDGTS